MSGLAQFVAARGLGTLQQWCEEGYKAILAIDDELSGEFAERQTAVLAYPCISSKSNTLAIGIVYSVGSISNIYTPNARPTPTEDGR